MTMRLLATAVILAAGAVAQQDAAGLEAKISAAMKTDPVMAAAAEELARARNLRTLGEQIFYMEISVDDADTFGVSATLGSAFAPQRARMRPLRVSVRVGGTNFDNTNSIYSDYYSGTRYDPDSLPLDNDMLALRHAYWLALDRAYKMAVEALGRKTAAVRGVTATETLPDFWDSPGRVFVEAPLKVRIDEEAWTNRVKQLSLVFANYPEITASSVDFEASQGTFYLMNTLRTVVRTPDRLGMVRVRASRQAPDGMLVYDGAVVQSLDPAQMPPETELKRVTESVAQNLMALAKAPMGEPYTGPVLFSGTASAQIFAEVMGSHLGAMRRPVSDPGRALPVPVSELDGRVGMRVLPEWMDLVDDPTLKEYRKTPLVGHYDVDMEGVFPAPVTLVEKGMLKAMLTTRQPVRGMTGTNGRARLPGVFGLKTARLSNLFVKAQKTETDEQLKARLIEMVKQQGKPYGMLVRKMDFPSSGSVDELRRISGRAGRSGGGGRPVSTPVLLYRVYPDGREELVRGLRFRSLTTRNFRDIAAAGTQEYQFDYMDNGAPMALMGAGNYIVGCSVVAPSILFEDLELEASADDMPKPPVVAPPPMTASK